MVPSSHADQEETTKPAQSMNTVDEWQSFLGFSCGSAVILDGFKGECPTTTMNAGPKVNGGGQDMSAIQKEKPRLEKIEGGRSRAGNGTNSNDGYQLHLAFDRQSHAKLVALKGQLRAASFGEVLRRAVEAYEIFDPHDVDEQPQHTEQAKPTSPKRSGSEIKRVNLRIPNWMKEFLDREKLEHGQPYNETIRQALRILTQLARNRDQLLRKVKKGKTNDAKHMVVTVDDDQDGLSNDEIIMLTAIA
ncbi:MAG: hypothetical protein ABJP66_06605 [Hyphomicrobiales bacterium]